MTDDSRCCAATASTTARPSAANTCSTSVASAGKGCHSNLASAWLVGGSSPAAALAGSRLRWNAAASRARVPRVASASMPSGGLGPSLRLSRRARVRVSPACSSRWDRSAALVPSSTVSVVSTSTAADSHHVPWSPRCAVSKRTPSGRPGPSASHGARIVSGYASSPSGRSFVDPRRVMRSAATAAEPRLVTARRMTMSSGARLAQRSWISSSPVPTAAVWILTDECR